MTAMTNEMWTLSNSSLAREAWLRFQVAEAWPTNTDLQRWADQRGISADVQHASETRPVLPGIQSMIRPIDFRLALPQLTHLPEAAAACEAAAALCQLAHLRYLSDDPGPSVSHADASVFAPALPARAAARAARVFFDEPLSPFSGGTLGPEWRFVISLDRVRQYAGVGSVSDLLDRQLTFATQLEALQMQQTSSPKV